MYIEKKLLKNLDFLLIAVILAILAFSAVVVSSASQSVIPSKPYYYAQRHLMNIALGLVGMFAILGVNYVQFAPRQKQIYGLMVFLLVIVLVPGIGHTSKGAQSWIDLGFMHLQPAEVAKLLFIMTFAQFLADRQNELKTFRDFLPTFVYVAAPMALIMLQPDMGTAMVFIGIYFGMMFVAGANLRILLALGFGGLIFVIVGVWFHLNVFEWLPLKTHQIQRLLAFIDPYNDGKGGLGFGYNVIQSIVAVGSGGLWGKGWGKGSQVQGNFLPEHHTDFIFSVLGEEFGFVGAALFLLLYLLLIYRLLLIAFHAKDMFGCLIVVGVVSMILFHLLINVGMTIGIMPITGIPLPLFSYGGSSMLVNLTALGLALNVGMRRQKILF
ncbi:MAG TPA: rod shape-determining protein RodA [Clostridia bacterium]|nr:rod shape-determining protein RodA [Clostridia bacterium]